jgi:hypothetical protein
VLVVLVDLELPQGLLLQLVLQLLLPLALEVLAHLFLEMVLVDHLGTHLYLALFRQQGEVTDLAEVVVEVAALVVALVVAALRAVLVILHQQARHKEITVEITALAHIQMAMVVVVVVAQARLVEHQLIKTVVMVALAQLLA